METSTSMAILVASDVYIMAVHVARVASCLDSVQQQDTVNTGRAGRLSKPIVTIGIVAVKLIETHVILTLWLDCMKWGPEFEPVLLAGWCGKRFMLDQGTVAFAQPPPSKDTHRIAKSGVSSWFSVALHE
jgi:hypothetical protein